MINAALADASWWEWICYLVVAALLVLGLVCVVVGLVRDDGWTTATGTLFEVIVWRLLMFADAIVRRKVRLRMYELALSKAKTPEEVADLLAALFDNRSTP